MRHLNLKQCKKDHFQCQYFDTETNTWQDDVLLGIVGNSADHYLIGVDAKQIPAEYVRNKL